MTVKAAQNSDKQVKANPVRQDPSVGLEPESHTGIVQRALLNPNMLSTNDIAYLQRTIGNKAVGQIAETLKLQKSRRGKIQDMSDNLPNIFLQSNDSLPNLNISVTKSEKLDNQPKRPKGKIIPQRLLSDKMLVTNSKLIQLQPDPTQSSITHSAGLLYTDEELQRYINQLRDRIQQISSSHPEYETLSSNLRVLEQIAHQRFSEENAYPRDVALFSAFLVRGGYIQEVTSLLPNAWRGMQEAELTAYLSQRFTENELRERFLAVYDARQTIKARFRKFNIIAAIVIGVIWAKDNIAEGEWGEAASKVTATGFTAYAFNRVLYRRDLPARALMARKAGEFGRWFRGAARTNRTVNFLSRRVAGALLLWDISQELLMSGGSGPDIPFDLIYEVDVDDPSTWREPDQTALNLGFNIWYRQACTPNHQEACGMDQYIGMVEGSMIRSILRFLDIAPHEAPQIRNNLYRIEGAFREVDLLILSIPTEQVSADDNVLVVATGQRSGSLVGGRGHYRKLEVRPANEAAERLFGSREPQYVPEYILHHVDFANENSRSSSE